MEKLSTGIVGFDHVTGGGLPQSRITLIAGAAGCGKTLFMLTACVRGAAEQGVPAVFFSFEERPDDLVQNAASIGLDLEPMLASGMLFIDHVKRPTDMTAEAGSYTLDGLLTRIDLVQRRTKARVIAIDTIETLFAMFDDERMIRQELVRVFDWLRARGLTAMITGERGQGQLTRHGLEEYISDCVILLDLRIVGDVATRRLRVVKYRGAQHGTNDFPFLIDTDGISVMPLSSALLDHKTSSDVVTTGMDGLDDALSGGIRRGSTMLISGTAGTGKSTMATTFIAAACQRGERAAVLSFEESPDEYLANAGSVGIDLRAAMGSGRLVVQSARPTVLGLEQHLVQIYRLIQQMQPKSVVIDPLSSLVTAGTAWEVHRMIIRLIDYLKRKQITTVLTAEQMDRDLDERGLGISSIIDTWITLEWDRSHDRFRRQLWVVKKRGSGHTYGYVPYTIGAGGIEFTRGCDAGQQ